MSVKVDTQRYLDLVEDANGICTFDIEASGLKSDYNSTICVSVKPFKDAPVTFSIQQLGNDQKIVRQAKDLLESFDCWVSYYGKGFDVKFLNTRLLKWGYEPIKPRHHIDMYYVLKYHTLMGRRSQEAYLSFLGTEEQKMKVSQNMWSEMGFKIKEHLPIMIQRCESDVTGLQQLYERTRHLIMEIKVQS
jgi:uncharacterized protein YprB with RNaseH-like and TPR domain